MFFINLLLINSQQILWHLPRHRTSACIHTHWFLLAIIPRLPVTNRISLQYGFSVLVKPLYLFRFLHFYLFYFQIQCVYPSHSCFSIVLGNGHTLEGRGFTLRTNQYEYKSFVWRISFLPMLWLKIDKDVCLKIDRNKDAKRVKVWWEIKYLYSLKILPHKLLINYKENIVVVQ